MGLTVPVIDMLITNKTSRPFKSNTPKYLAVHWTANEGPGSDADNNARYFQNSGRSASAHYCVDDHQIVRCVPENEVAYSVGATKYTAFKAKYIGADNPNNHVISVEMCVNSNGKFWSMYSNAAHLCADILKRHGWGTDKLIRHYDVTGKNCPAFFVSDEYAKKYMRGTAHETWAAFRNDVARLMK